MRHIKIFVALSCSFILSLPSNVLTQTSVEVSSDVDTAEVIKDEGEVKSDIVDLSPTAVSKEKKKLKLPKTGVLASTIETGDTDLKTNMPWGAGKQVDTIKVPIGASIVKNENYWNVRISNNSKDRSFSLSAELAQYSSSGQKVKSDPFSYSLQPGQSVERRVTAASNVYQAQVNLTDWKEQ
ncbi:MAG: hypothetical protein GYA55_11400 [SAR324 cluster bacterium]|uniref:Uncharacterized protein n=1 Tax=SAR324 cluster bacterium TaxID=2024889 RepID=A0A7X9FT05_9DELT|nr:hypothetical protein [SAR324 cluster bacterium]